MVGVFRSAEQIDNKLTVNGTKSSEDLHSDLGGSFRFRRIIQIKGGHLDLGGSFRFRGGHSD